MSLSCIHLLRCRVHAEAIYLGPRDFVDASLSYARAPSCTLPATRSASLIVAHSRSWWNPEHSSTTHTHTSTRPWRKLMHAQCGNTSNGNQTVEQEPTGRIGARAMMDDRQMQPHGARDELIASSLLNFFKIVPETAPQATQVGKRQQSSDQPLPIPTGKIPANNQFVAVTTKDSRIVVRCRSTEIVRI